MRRRSVLGFAAVAVGLLALALPWRSSKPSADADPALLHYDASDLHRSLSPDSIRAIDRPVFDSREAASKLLPPSALVAGLVVAGHARAYPIDVLSLHEVVNDRLGGVPVALTWCPLCQSAVVFDRRVNGRVLRFGVSGLLLRGNQVLFDRQTGSLWSQLLAGSIRGRYRGTRLRTLPVVVETWSAWQRGHPEALVLSLRRDPLASRFLEPFTISTARGPEESNDPYGAYVAKVGTYFPRVVRGIRESELVIGLLLNGRTTTYRRLTVERARAVDDEIGGVPVLVVHDPDTQADAAYDRRLDGQTLTFAGGLIDRGTGTRWDPATGQAVRGPMRGRRLRQLVVTTSYWFAWRDLHPETAVYGEGNPH